MDLGKLRVSGIYQEIPFHRNNNRGNGYHQMFGIIHPLCSNLLRGLRPGKFLPAGRKVFLWNFDSWNSIGYVRPTILQVQSGDIGNPGIEVDEEFQETQ